MFVSSAVLKSLKPPSGGKQQPSDWSKAEMSQYHFKKQVNLLKHQKLAKINRAHCVNCYKYVSV